ncbi:MAG: N-acetylmuramoyl-L-alanine amidase [Oculatellaceae cyanobacterium Prado106]|nr:N-acetylmuramoyl-L-alanine amidase [Oculatellaceae cyanobacterium Prado106]
MRLHWLLPGLVSVFLLATPARAGRVDSMQFNPSENRLEFNTDEGVQPRAQLLTDPLQLVIDLPGIQVGSNPVTQEGEGAIQSIRLEQLDRQTARIIVQYQPGYTIDPQSIRFRGISPTQWTVQLPEPTRSDASRPASSTSSNTSASRTNRTTSSSTSSSTDDSTGSSSRNSNATRPASTTATAPTSASQQGTTQVESIEVTREGIYVWTSGGAVAWDRNPSPSRNTLEVNIDNATLSNNVASGRIFNVGRYGVERLQVEQRDARGQSRVRLTLRLQDDAPEFDIRANDEDGFAIYQEASSYNRVRASLTQSPPIARQAASSNTTATAPSTRDPEDNSEDNSVVDVPPPRSTSRITPRRPSPPATTTASRDALEQLQRLGSESQSGRSSAPLPQVRQGQIVVAVDPGHGGADVGAVGIDGIREADIVLDIGKKLAEILSQQGVQVVLTRDRDVEIDLEPRVSYAEQVNADLFVSVHANAINMSRPDVNGLETYYYSSGQGLASDIHRSILDSMDIRDRGVRTARFYVLRRTSMPAVLVEVGFVTGAEDQRRLSDSDYRTQMAQAIARGVLQYIQDNLTSGR